MLVVQPIYFCKRDLHSDSVVAVSAIKREKDERVPYFPVVGVGWAFERIAFAKVVYGFASLFCHGESPCRFQGQRFGAGRSVLCGRGKITSKSFSVNAYL
jgi:hypothetical protein